VVCSNFNFSTTSHKKSAARLITRTGEAMLSYDELAKLARFCANQARTVTEKKVRALAWRAAVEYREDAARLGEPPDIGEIPSDLEKV
jgi:hypothetical protein